MLKIEWELKLHPPCAADIPALFDLLQEVLGTLREVGHKTATHTYFDTAHHDLDRAECTLRARRTRHAVAYMYKYVLGAHGDLLVRREITEHCGDGGRVPHAVLDAGDPFERRLPILAWLDRVPRIEPVLRLAPTAVITQRRERWVVHPPELDVEHAFQITLDHVSGRMPDSDHVVTFDEIEIEITRLFPATIERAHEAARRARQLGFTPVHASKYACVRRMHAVRG